MIPSLIFNHLPGCFVRIDDILISRESDEIHLENLHRVLSRLQDPGLKLSPYIYIFFMFDKVEHLVTTISASEISPTDEKVQAIMDAAPSTNVSELQSFLEAANFLRKVVPDFLRLASSL